jgi:hypothetical protein
MISFFTDANVFINIFGENGDTGNRPLRKSSTNKNKFERNSIDKFLIEAVNLRAFKKIIIGHDGTGPGAGWFLKKVSVKQIDNPKFDQVFECNRWLAKDEDDGLIVRELSADNSQFLDKTSYHIRVKTGDVSKGGTDANVHIKIFGDKASTEELQLKYSDNTSNKFERGQVDLFKIEYEDLGKVGLIDLKKCLFNLFCFSD